MKKILTTIAKVGLAAAKKSGNQVSWFGSYQKQEPAGLKKFKK